MSDPGWNPTPPGWTTTRKAVARTDEEVWRALLDGRTIRAVVQRVREHMHDEPIV
jgi:hypothetical protein